MLQFFLFVGYLFNRLCKVNLIPDVGFDFVEVKPSESNDHLKKAPTKIPPCPLCQQEHGSQNDRIPSPPPKIINKRGRPCTIDTSGHFCPNQECCYYGWLGRGNIRSNGHPNGDANRQLECKVCHRTFVETTGTIFYRKKTSPETIGRVLTALAEGLALQSVARVFSIPTDTILAWLSEAAQQTDAVSKYLLHDLELNQVQVDELWALLAKQQVTEGVNGTDSTNGADGANSIDSTDSTNGTDGADGADRADPPHSAIDRISGNKGWVWAAIDPESKLFLAYVVGDRSASCAQILIHLVVSMLAVGCMPLFLSDQWSAYAQALLTHFGHWVDLPRSSKYGPAPKPRWLPDPNLQYGQVVKERIGRRLVSVSSKIIYGSAQKIEAILSKAGVGNIINTAFIERLNLTIRQHVPALGRKVSSVAKNEIGLVRQLSLFRTYYNFCLPHQSLRFKLDTPQPTGGRRNAKKWQTRTPAMAARITNQVLSMQELLTIRVPPWPAKAQVA